MADHFYGVTLASRSKSDVVFGTSTGSTVIELRVTDATTGLTGNKAALLKAIELIERYIATSDAPA